MLFNSLAFGIFLPIVFIAYWALPHKFRWPLLLIASYYFYMSWNPKYIVLIMLTTIVSYTAARIIDNQSDILVRKLVLAATFVICIGVLFIFKYFNFISDSVAKLLNMVALPVQAKTLELLLPVGISFYTFQTLSYVVDVYRKKVEPEKNLGIFATFISFFPQLVAGPIERTENLLPQIKSEKKFDSDMASYGLKLMLWGFFKKIVIADVIAEYVDNAYAALTGCTGWDLLIAVLLFTVQIYCDFSGYSDIAIGTAKLLGINLMTNFKSPYLATSVKEFWGRWHISLSTWFRDYLYIPLGGNRCSKIKRDRNLLITFLVSGLWHGANWTYVIWGGIHGVAQILENRLNLSGKKIASWLRIIVVFIFCNLAWVFFRAQSLNDALYVIGHIFTGGAESVLFRNVSILEIAGIIISIVILFIYDYFAQKTDVIHWISKKNVVLRWGIYLIMLWVIIISIPDGGPAEFVYFQF